MPKQTFHINRFEGGMNTDFAPEDIPDNSLLDALGISVSNIGRIVMQGDPHADSGITAQEVNNAGENPGYGLFSFSSDYAQDNSEAATKYLVLQDGSYTHIWDGANWDAHSDVVFDNGAGTASHPTEPSYYAPNGDLRVCDGKFNHANNFDNNVKWFGYTPNKTIGTGKADATIGGWNVQDASIEGGYPKDSSGIATNAYMVDGETNANGTVERGVLQGTRDWGVNLAYVPASNSGTFADFSGSTWQSSTETDYKFYASYVYDDVQEGSPTPLKMYPGFNSLDNVASVPNLRFFDRAKDGTTDEHIDTLTRTGTNLVATMSGEHDFVVGDTVHIESASAGNEFDGIYSITARDATTFTVAVPDSGTSGAIDLSSDNDSVASVVGTNLAVYFSVNLKFNNEETTNFNFGATTINAAGNGNERITASRIYWSSSDEGHSNLWIMFEANFEKGLKAYGVGKDEPTVTDYIPWTQDASDATDWLGVDWKANGTDFNVWKHPPRYETYESLNGYSHSSKLDAKWKTAVIANGRAYVGNVKRRKKSTFNVNDTALTSGKQTWDSTVKNDPTFGDRILKSPVDRFDTFPEEMAIELFGGDDGDSIVKLETFADRLFVFKKNTLHIINIAKDVEILESSHKGLGLDGGNPCQSCLTKNGIAWINSSGAYHYNGESIESLTDNKIESFWKGKTSNHIDQGTAAGAGQRPKAFWLANTSDVPSIGHDTASNKLIIHKTTSDAGDDEEDVLIYDMKIKAWTWLNEALDENNDRTNMANYDGMLVYHEKGATADDPMHKYDDSPHPPGHDVTTVGDSLRVYTKPYDFGAPLQRKKIYKVYVTYRCEGVQGSDNVQMQYYINGDTSNLYNFTTGATNTFNIGSDDDNVHTTSSVAEFDTTAGLWDTAAFKPATSSEANNVKSFGLYIFNQSGAVDKDFEINDITIVYRTKSVK